MSRRLVFGTGRWIGLAPIGEINSRTIFPIRGAEVDADEGADDSQADGESDQDDEDEGAEGEDDEDKPKPKPKARKQSDDSGSSVIKTLRAQLRAVSRELAVFKADKKKAELADASDVEKANAELAETKERLAEVEPRFRETLTELEIIKVSSQLKMNWADIEDVLNDRKLRQTVEFDDETGEITGVEEALKDLKKRKPHFLAKPEDSEEDDDGREKDKGPKRTGASFNGSKNKRDARVADRERLLKSYPVLGRMQEGS